MEEPINQPVPSTSSGSSTPTPTEAGMTKAKAPLAIGTMVALLVVATIAWAATHGSSNNQSALTYKDGTYSATGHYRSPAGPETIEVTLTVKDDVVTDANVTSDAVVPNSQRFQGIFIQNFKPMVVGVRLDQLNLTKVSGSSLTPGGFNDAVAQIKTQAAA